MCLAEEDRQQRNELAADSVKHSGPCFHRDVTSISSLPLIAKDKYRVLVVNDPTTDVDDVWLQFSVLDSANAGKVADGSWAEVRLPSFPTSSMGTRCPM